jgi:hypothetical protein
LRGKPWSIDEERRLRELVEEGKGIQMISQVLDKTRVSVRAKLYNLGLSLKDATVDLQNSFAAASAAASSPATTVNPDPVVAAIPAVEPAPVISPTPAVNSGLGENIAADMKSKDPLPSIEEKMRELDDASKALHHKGLSPTEIKRLGKIIDAARVYNHLFEKYAHYCDLENELVELRRQLASERSKN